MLIDKDKKDEIEDPIEEVRDEVDDSIEIDESIEIDDDVVSDEIIEIDDEDIEDIESEVIKKSEDFESDEEIVLSKHTIEGKHSLKYDSIFKGKKEEATEGDDFDLMFSNEKFEVDKGSSYWFESIDNENYVKEKKVKEKVYDVLIKNTDLNFLSNRRKPSRVDFNQYYHLLKTHLKDENFSNIEIFNELSVYFSDNLFNMFKLLDNKWRNLIISELQDHIGNKSYSKDLLPRNIHVGTEVEFEWEIDNNVKIITGVVVDTNYEDLTYKIDSYENIYLINIKDIKKILNNSKFKYNLNKLNNIDFL